MIAMILFPYKQIYKYHLKQQTTLQIFFSLFRVQQTDFVKIKTH